MKKYLIDLTFDEKKELISNIDELKDVLRDNIQDAAWHWLDKYLEGVPAS